MTVYNKEAATSEVLVARERAPLAGTEDMYHGNQSLASKVSIETSQVPSFVVDVTTGTSGRGCAWRGGGILGGQEEIWEQGNILAENYPANY